MRAIVVAFVAAGCGRIGFDPIAATGDGPAASHTVYLLSNDVGTPSTILTLDPASGQLAIAGSFDAGTVLGGLAAWDANTLYAAAANTLYQITLAPFAASPLPFTAGVASLERSNDQLVGCDDSTGELITFVPGGAPSRLPLTSNGSAVASDGGDVVQLSDGRWLWFTNSTQQLYELDLATAIATPLGAPATSAPYISGMFRDDLDHVYLTSGDADEVLEIDVMTGQLGAAATVCLSCPTTYDLKSGDATRTP